MASHNVKEILASDGSPILSEVARRDTKGRNIADELDKIGSGGSSSMMPTKTNAYLSSGDDIVILDSDDDEAEVFINARNEDTGDNQFFEIKVDDNVIASINKVASTVDDSSFAIYMKIFIDRDSGDYNIFINSNKTIQYPAENLQGNTVVIANSKFTDSTISIYYESVGTSYEAFVVKFVKDY